MPTVNEIIKDKLIGHQIGLLRFSTSINNKLIPLLNKSTKDIIDQLQNVNTEWSQKRLNTILGNMYDILDAQAPKQNKLLTNELTQLSRYETEYQKQLIEGTLPIKFDMAMPSKEMLSSIVTSQPFQGKLLKEWVEDLAGVQKRTVRDAIRMGMVEGQTIDQMVRRIRGTKALNYRDGVMEISRRGAQAMVRTAVNHTATSARDLLYQENEDLIKGVQWVSTLDMRTTPICRARDGQVFPVNEGPRPPAHINCRSTTVPVIKSWKELGLDGDEYKSTRASMDGQVAEDLTYNDWLKKQSNGVQDEVLGKGRAELFRNGVSVDKFVDDVGRQYTLKELSYQNLGGESMMNKNIIMQSANNYKGCIV